MVNNWINIIQEYCLPPTCLFCNEPSHNPRDLCSFCEKALPRNKDCCIHCGQPMTLANNPSNCGQCLTNPPYFDSTLAPFRYQRTVRYAIQSFKYHNNYTFARLLGELLASEIATEKTLPQRLIPVPLHASRYRERGFNQAFEIAKIISQHHKIPVDNYSLQRRRPTDYQSHLKAKSRSQNIKNAFLLSQKITVSHVAIIDDVMTTGNTVNELARMLKTAGVQNVDVWVCARA